MPVTLAHTVGGQSNLPVPVWLFAYGAAFALFIAFIALRTAWPRPRLPGWSAGTALPSAVQRAVPALWVVLRVVGLLFFGLTLWAAVFGSAQSGNNISPVAVCVVFWIGVPIVCAFVGDVYAAANPFDTIARILRIPAQTGDTNTGLWPAALMILSFTWLELAFYDGCTDPIALSRWLGVYTIAALTGATLWGRTWLRTSEGFAALFALLAHLAPFYWDAEERQLRGRVPLSGLSTIRPRPGLFALIAVTLGSTAFDGFNRTTWWQDIVVQRDGWDRTFVSTAGLLAMIALVAILWFGAATLGARVISGSPRELVHWFLPALVPILIAYAIAHYFSLLVFDGQNFIALASDPFGRGWDLFGTIDNTPDYRLVSTRTVAYVQVASLVVGHLAAIVTTHDIAIRRLKPRAAAVVEYPILALMIVSTVLAMLMLLGP